MAGDFESRVPDYRRRIEAFMSANLPGKGQVPDSLNEAIAYAVHGEGKRIRPLLVYATGELLGLKAAVLDCPAAAIELIHTYSLVHDDLPAMDDDDLRRGRPTLHKQFDEATAILVGDALQSLAFQLLAESDADATVKCRWISMLARAAGPEGMVGGQSMDLNTESKPVTLEALQTMHKKKSGALIVAAVDMAAIACPSLTDSDRKKLTGFANDIGMAFQIRDDVLDVSSSTETLGKPQGSDQSRGRATYVSLLGMTGSIDQFERYHTKARETLSDLGQNTEGLLWLADYIVKRSN